MENGIKKFFSSLTQTFPVCATISILFRREESFIFYFSTCLGFPADFIRAIAFRVLINECERCTKEKEKKKK